MKRRKGKAVARAKVNKEVAEKRIAKRYHKLHAPIVELVQALQDAIPPGAVLGERIELTQADGHIEVAMTLKPVRLVLNDGERRFTLCIEEDARNISR